MSSERQQAYLATRASQSQCKVRAGYKKEWSATNESTFKVQDLGTKFKFGSEFGCGGFPLNIAAYLRPNDEGLGIYLFINRRDWIPLPYFVQVYYKLWIRMGTTEPWQQVLDDSKPYQNEAGWGKSGVLPFAQLREDKVEYITVKTQVIIEDSAWWK